MLVSVSASPSSLKYAKVRLCFTLDSLISESQYLSFFLVYVLGSLSLFRSAQSRVSVRIMSVGLSQLFDLHLKTLRASSLFFSTPAIAITTGSYILNLQASIEIKVKDVLLQVYSKLKPGVNSSYLKKT